ncbi:MAG: hypothetical protein M3P92_02380 [Actinomycetota bacterium]|nr:hypothetical protein [Actinomycetota bacterium]
MTEGAYWRTGARLPVCWVGLQGLGGVPLSDVAHTAASVLAMVLSVFSLYLQWRDRRPRLEIRVRYEYRAAPLDGASPGDPDPPAIHDRSQEGLYLLLGDFLREYGLEYPQGTPLVRFALANKGTQPIYLDSIRLVVVRPREPRGRRLILDPAGDRVVPLELAGGEPANVLGAARRGNAVELVPADSVGYRFELTRLANTLKGEGYSGNVRLAFRVKDRLSREHVRPFNVNTDLWAYPKAHG